MSITLVAPNQTTQKAINSSVSVADGGTTAILTIQIQPRQKIKLRDFGNYIDNVAAWGSVSWVFVWNGVPLSIDGQNIATLDQIGYAAQRQPISQDIVLGPVTFVIYGVNAIGTGAAVAMGVSLGYDLISSIN